MKLFDAHCHLVESAAFERAAAAGIAGAAVCGTNPDDWAQIIQAAEQFPQIVPMVGIHPWFISADWRSSIEGLKKMLRENPNAGVGETGLDFSSLAKASADKQGKSTNRAEQEECFIEHLELAAELNRPVAVHCVKAWGRLVEILQKHPAPKIIMHAYSGSVELVEQLAGLNCRFSFCGNVTNPKAKRARAAAAAVPAELLLIETDSPDFPPAGYSEPNEPANLVHVARTVAELRKVSVDEVAARTFENAKSIFM